MQGTGRACAADECNATDELSSLSLFLSLSLNGVSTAASTVDIIFPLGFVGEGGRGRESYAQCVGYYSTVAEHHGLAGLTHEEKATRIELDDGGWQKDKEM